MSNIAGRVLPTVSPEGGPQQIGEIKDYLWFFVVISWRKLQNENGVEGEVRPRISLDIQNIAKY